MNVMHDIHNEIATWLAAAVHDELSQEEREQFDQHLASCEQCREAFAEEKIMNKVIAQTMEPLRPDERFEQRIVAHFRDRISERRGLIPFFAGLMQLRATQITAVAAILLGLTQVGRLLTHEEQAFSSRLPSGRDEGPISNTESLSRVTAPYPARKAAPGQAGRAFTDSISLAKDTGALAPTTAPPAPPAEATPPPTSRTRAASKDDKATSERVIVTGSNIPTADESGPVASSYAQGKEVPAEERPHETNGNPGQSTPAGPTDSRKLIRNASVELEVASFDQAAQKITGFAAEDGGYVATTTSEKQANGKLSGEIVVKVLPDNLDRFLGKLRGLGELKNQTLGTEDVTKQYFDTESRLKNQRAMEQRLLEILKKKSEDINDLLQVEKELGRVREQIEQMQGELKFMDAQVQFATVTITLAEKDMNIPAAFLLKERAQLALFTSEVEKTYNDIKALASPKVQITNATLDRDSTGRVSARVSMLIAPEESEAVIGKTKAMGRVQNFQVQTERVSHGGEGMSENAKTERDKVELNITITRDEQEQALQQTSLRIRTSDVNDRTKQLRTLSEKQSGRIRSSSFSRDPNGREYANVSLRVALKNYGALMQSLDSLGKLEDVSVHREDRPGAEIDEANAPADVTIQVYSQGNIVSEETGVIATLRRTLAQSAAAIMWSLRMIGVAIAFFLPWIAALAVAIWIFRIIRRRRSDRS
jgi:hypothetical protein